MNKGKLRCLVVSTDQTIRQVFEPLASGDVWAVTVFGEPARLFSVAQDDVRFVLLDESAAGGGYVSIIKRLRKQFPAVDTFVVGGPKAEDVQLRERAEGVDYYFERPLEPAPLGAVVGHRLELSRLKAESGLVGRSAVMEEILEAVLQVAPTEVAVLIEGESGTGKDLLAKAIHLKSRRHDAPFVAINCGSLAEGVLESELFGHEKGSFTGAVAQRLGVFERANGGTIFLDEVGEMSPNMQVRLLRVLETGEVLRVGGTKSFRVNVRVIAATNRKLGGAVRDGSFRQDLYYRLKGVNLYLPTLRERRDDIPILVDYFVHEAERKHGRGIKGLQADALRELVSYPWPGNVRELRNTVDTLVVLAAGAKITGELVAAQLDQRTQEAEKPMLPVPLHRSREEAERELIYASVLALHRDVREILEMLRESRGRGPWEGGREVFTEASGEPARRETLAQMERAAIMDALRTSGGNRRKAAESLGISERTLYRKIKEYALV